MIRFKSCYPFLSLLGILLLTSACQNNQTQTNEDEDAPVIPVEISEVQRGDISAYYSNTATLEAEQEAIVVAKVRGIIKNILVEEGDQVSEGQILATIENDEYKIEVERAKAQMDRLYSEFQRSKELYDKNLTSAEVYQNARYEYESQKAAYELAQLNLQYTEIKSPISGVISERFIKKGNMIGTDEQVFKVSDFSPLKAVIHIPEHEMSKISVNQEAYLKADAIPGQSYIGKVQRISPVVDPESGTFKVTVYINDQTDKLRPGMFGRIQIEYDTKFNTRMIPKTAVINEDLYQTVYVIKDSVAYKKTIRTGYVNGSNIEVLEGLDDGEMVVTTGQGSLQDSSRVNVVNS